MSFWRKNVILSRNLYLICFREFHLKVTIHSHTRRKLDPISPLNEVSSSTKVKPTHKVVNSGRERDTIFFRTLLSSDLYDLVFRAIKPIHHWLPRKVLKTMERQKRGKCDPPRSVRGMKSLDKTKFTTTVKVLGVEVPVNNISKIAKHMKKELVKIPKVKPIADVNDDDLKGVKILLFDPEKYSSIKDFSTEQINLLKEMNVDLNSAADLEIDLRYENWNAAEILRAVLPVDSDTVSGFAVVGHIAHINLKDELSDYKHLIGEVLLEKTKNIKTVVNKLNTIDNTYRNFQMELLAGEDNYITTVKENGCSFELDFSKVYWNSRLGTEHFRIVESSPEDAVVYDVFAGIGPFSIPLAKKRCTVLANDLNPESFHWLKQNIKSNKHKGKITAYNLDGRDFIRSVVKDDMIDKWKSSNPNMFIIMNLPALAIDFLDAFVDIGIEENGFKADISSLKMPHVFCYCFTKSEDAETEVCERLASSFGYHPDLKFDIFFVRNVAPNKDMYRVSFEIPRTVLFGKGITVKSGLSLNEDDNPVQKKQKISHQ